MKRTRIIIATVTVLLLQALVLNAEGYRKDEIIVKFKAAVPDEASAVDSASSRPALIAVDDADKAIAELKEAGLVEYAEPNYIIEAEDVPEDWPYKGQWTQLSLAQAWDLLSSAGVTTEVVVAVVDSGVDFSHPDLAGVLMEGFDFAANDSTPEDNSGHGTKVCGILGAVGDNGIGIAGVAWDVDLVIMPVKFMDTDIDGKTTGTLSDAVKAIYYAVDHGAQVINASWGFYSSSRSLQDAIDYALKKGVIVVCSAGNNAQNNDLNDHFPSNCPLDNVVAVAAMGADGTLASFSNYGSKNVDVAAPGVGITTTTINGKYVSWVSGTSFATPFVSAIAAMMLAYAPDMDPVAVRDALVSSASNSPSAAASFAVAGLGCVNAYSALTMAEGMSGGTQDSSGSQGGTGTADASSGSGGGSGGSGCLIETAGSQPFPASLLLAIMAIVLFRIRRTRAPE